MDSRGKIKTSRILTICSLAIGTFFAGYFLLPALASYPATPYAPGETLNPSCSPGDANCTVYAPLTTTLTTSTAVSIGTSTLNFGNSLIILDGTAQTLTLASTTLGNATSTNFFSTGVSFTNANGTGITSTNGYFTTLGSGTFSPTNISAVSVTSTNLSISGVLGLPNNSVIDAMIASAATWNSKLSQALASSTYLTFDYPALATSSFLSISYPSLATSTFLNQNYTALATSSFLGNSYTTLATSSFLGVAYPSLASSTFLTLSYTSLASSSFLGIDYPALATSTFLNQSYSALATSSFLGVSYPALATSTFLALTGGTLTGGLIFTTASGTSVTSTNGFFTSLSVTNFSPANINTTNVTTTNLSVTNFSPSSINTTNVTTTNLNAGQISINTSTHDARLTIQSNTIATSSNALTIYNTSSTLLMKVRDSGDISLGAFDGLYYEASTTITYANSIETGGLIFEDNAGMVSWVDMNVTASSTTGTPQSYTASIGGSPMLQIYADSNGIGGIQNQTISINTSTTSSFKFFIDAGATTNSGLYLIGTSSFNGALSFTTISGTSITSTNFFSNGLFTLNGAAGSSITSTNINSGNYSGSGTFTNVTSTNLSNSGLAVFATSTFASAGGRVSIGTTTLSDKLMVQGLTNATSSNTFSTYNQSGTNTMKIRDSGDISFANDGLYYEASTTVSYLNTLETGPLNFDDDAGMISWVDMQVSSTAAGTPMSYTASIDDNPMLMIYAESNGSGGIQNQTISINTSTTSTYKLYIDAGGSANAGLGVNGFIRSTGFIAGTTTLDLAETFPLRPGCEQSGTCPGAGDTVCSATVGDGDTSTFVIDKCSSSSSDNIVGVISENPGFVLGGYSPNDAIKGSDPGIYPSAFMPVAMAGRVPVNISTANGSITTGDLLTSSDIPGVAVKAIEPGRVIGVALQSFGGPATGSIKMFVNPHWSPGNLSEGQIRGDLPNFSIRTTLDKFTLAIKNSLRKLGLLISDGVAKVNKIFTNELCVGNTCINEQQLQELLNKNQVSSSAPAPMPTVSPTIPSEGAAAVEESPPAGETNLSQTSTPPVIPADPPAGGEESVPAGETNLSQTSTPVIPNVIEGSIIPSSTEINTP